MKKNMKNDAEQVVWLGLDYLEPCPWNREFEQAGEAWEEFVESVRGGVKIPLVVRPMEAGRFHEVLAGHRRLAAAEAAGLAAVPCLVREMDDGAALQFLVNENLQREGLSPVDEGRLMRALREETGEDDAKLAARVNRSIEWVRTRQFLLDLGDEVCAAVRSRDPDRHLPLGSVEEIRRVRAEWRDEAVQMVLHPSFDTSPLGPARARECLEELLVRPKLAEEAWKAGENALEKAWGEKLRVLGGMDAAIPVRVCAWEERQAKRRGAVEAEARVPLGMCAPDAPEGMTWAALAAKHGLVVWVVPRGDDPEMSEALVSRSLLELGEAEEHLAGGEVWLSAGKAGVARDERVEKALKDVETPGHDADTDEADATVIDQRMEWHGVIDLGAVKRVAMWAVSADADPMDAPEWVPPWARKLGVEGMWEEIDGVCNWLMGLRKGG